MVVRVFGADVLKVDAGRLHRQPMETASYFHVSNVSEPKLAVTSLPVFHYVSTRHGLTLITIMVVSVPNPHRVSVTHGHQ